MALAAAVSPSVRPGGRACSARSLVAGNRARWLVSQFANSQKYFLFDGIDAEDSEIVLDTLFAGHIGLMDIRMHRCS